MSGNHNNTSSSIQSDILLEELTENGVMRLTLNDSKRRNALSEEMMAKLTNSLDQASKNDAVRVIVIAGKGPAFCAGHDLKQMSAGRNNADNGHEYFKEVFTVCSKLMQLITNNSKPVIAEVAGVAAAAGCQLVASCDLAIAGESARFVTPGVNIGLFCSTPMVALSRNVSNKAAMEMLLTGEMVDSKKAEHIGLINRVVDDKKITEATMAMAEIIASKSRMTVKTGKQAFYRQKEMSLTDAYDYASSVMVENMLKSDAKEGIDAFSEKRQPKWQDE
jgi:enoyl-CoA hydratase/carnithine racemase